MNMINKLDQSQKLDCFTKELKMNAWLYDIITYCSFLLAHFGCFMRKREKNIHILHKCYISDIMH